MRAYSGKSDHNENKPPLSQVTMLKDVFELWAATMTVLHKIPDNLRSRTQLLVAEADPLKLYEFVRDEIRTYAT